MVAISFDEDVPAAIEARGFAWLPRRAWSVAPELAPELERLRAEWEQLEPDRYLAGGARFRLRRYGRARWAPADDVLVPLPHEPYFQPEEENSYAGGIARDFPPVAPETWRNPFVQALVRACFACLPIPGPMRGEIWEVRMHQMRIVATPQAPGLPTPEGVHQDGTDFHTLHLLRRDNIEGGETTIHGLDREPIFRCTMRDVLDTLILEDPRVMHGVTPVITADGRSVGTRDVFGIDYHHHPHLCLPGESHTAR